MDSVYMIARFIYRVLCPTTSTQLLHNMLITHLVFSRNIKNNGVRETIQSCFSDPKCEVIIIHNSR